MTWSERKRTNFALSPLAGASGIRCETVPTLLAIPRSAADEAERALERPSAMRPNKGCCSHQGKSA